MKHLILALLVILMVALLVVLSGCDGDVRVRVNDQHPIPVMVVDRNWIPPTCPHCGEKL